MRGDGFGGGAALGGIDERFDTGQYLVDVAHPAQGRKFFQMHRRFQRSAAGGALQQVDQKNEAKNQNKNAQENFPPIAPEVQREGSVLGMVARSKISRPPAKKPSTMFQTTQVRVL